MTDKTAIRCGDRELGVEECSATPTSIEFKEVGTTTATQPGSHKWYMAGAPVHRLEVSFSSHAVPTRGLGKRARDAFLPCTVGSVETTKRLAQRHPRLLLRREPVVPDRKTTVHVLRSGCQRVCARMSPWVEPCDIVDWHPGPQGSTTHETIHDPRRKLTMLCPSIGDPFLPER